MLIIKIKGEMQGDGAARVLIGQGALSPQKCA